MDNDLMRSRVYYISAFIALLVVAFLVQFLIKDRTWLQKLQHLCGSTIGAQLIVCWDLGWRPLPAQFKPANQITASRMLRVICGLAIYLPSTFT